MSSAVVRGRMVWCGAEQHMWIYSLHEICMRPARGTLELDSGFQDIFSPQEDIQLDYISYTRLKGKLLLPCLGFS